MSQRKRIKKEKEEERGGGDLMYPDANEWWVMCVYACLF